MKKTRFFALILILAMAIGLLSGCGGGESGSGGSSDAGSSTGSPSSSSGGSASSGGSGEQEQLQVDEGSGIEVSTKSWFRGDVTMYKSNAEGPAKKTPADTLVIGGSMSTRAAEVNTYQDEYAWSHQIYEGLVERDLTGETDFIPALATEWGYDDEGNFNITLREGVKFHDGTTLDADDVLFSLQRTASSHANKSSSAMKKIDFEKSYKTDDLHLTLVFKAPVGSLLYEFSTNYCAIMSKDYFDANPDAPLLDSDPGSGPYKLVGTVDGIGHSFERFDDYWGEPGSVKYIEYKVYKDNSVMAIDFLNGDLDICFNNNYNTVSQFLNGEIPGATLYQTPSRSIYLDLTTRGDVPLADVRLRQALAYSIDYESLILGAYQNEVMADTTTGPFMPGTKYEVDLGGLEYNPEKAIELLAECGYSTSNPCQLKLISTNNAFNSAAANIIQAFGSAVGFDIQVDIKDSSGTNAITGSPDVPAEYDLFVCTSTFNTGTPECFLADREMYTNPAETSAMSGIEDPTFNELAKKAADSISEEERADLYAEIQGMFYENLWTIQLTNANAMNLAYGYVGEFDMVSGYFPAYNSLTIVE